ncbi:CmpA/NrtA family ABC transporter substrate-binding protein [Rubellicoccus peritrichatus]|uniref:CmpA/NrtA family ABC transporter substrate-binding protein n=1 Tax=Rubellicoccus peritrichatus TaxID=3080537 RepID=A0AAQ3LDA0_9BACT|nr:CmpA/NrtA family ABC transporter substrate-binding protein [Puniceicoccus sp. CR14]WOO39919.1 CmpA/NrtA family ABC transporter substrate-binding protein [Puniceicoccus sp. CR14]
MSKRHSNLENGSNLAEKTLRIGMVRLTDAAPFIIAGEMGLFKEQGLEVRLSWELGWASIRHKIAYGELDAAHAIAPMALSISTGVDVAATPCRAIMVLNRLGDAITLSHELYERGVRSGDDFRQEIKSTRGKKRYTLGIVSHDSTHNILLRQWLKSLDLDPDNDVRLVIIPPGQALRNLRAKTLDGYCVGEPWNSLAVREGIGWCPVLSHDIEQDHVEKILLARENDYIEKQDQFDSLAKALRISCEYCADPENASVVAKKMRRTSYLGAASHGMEKCLLGEFDRGIGNGFKNEEVIRFCSGEDTEFSISDKAWLINGAHDAGWLKTTKSEGHGLADRIFSGNALTALDVS